MSARSSFVSSLPSLWPHQGPHNHPNQQINSPMTYISSPPTQLHSLVGSTGRRARRESQEQILGGRGGMATATERNIVEPVSSSGSGVDADDTTINSSDLIGSSQQFHHHHPHTQHETKIRISTPTPRDALKSRGGERGTTSSIQQQQNQQQTYEAQINLLLPAPASSSNLASITQETNERLANFMRYHDECGSEDGEHSASHSHAQHQQQSVISGTSPLSKSHRLLLGHLTHLLTPQELESEKEISRLLSNWHPGKSAKSFALLTSKIKHILSERVHADANSSSALNGFTGKVLNEDERLTDELSKRENSVYRINVPNYATSIRIEIDVSEGRIEMHVACGAPYSAQNGAQSATAAAASQSKDTTSASAANASSSSASATSTNPTSKSLWNLRGGVGHHVLAIHTSDALYKSAGSPANETLYVSVHAFQSSVYGIKLTVGGRNRGGGIVGFGGGNNNNNNNNNNLLDDLDLSSLVNYSSSPPSSRHASRPPTLIHKHAPSTRNLRSNLEQRIKLLNENPKVLKEFLVRVGRMKKVAERTSGNAAAGTLHGASSSASLLSKSSSSLHPFTPPSQLSDRALRKRNEQHREIEEAKLAAMREVVQGEEKSNQQQQQGHSHASYHQKEAGFSSRNASQAHLALLAPHPPTAVAPHVQLLPPHPQPLTRISLNHIAHIQAIDGVSEVFYEMVKEMDREWMEGSHSNSNSNERLGEVRILDDKDYIQYDRDDPSPTKPQVVKLKSTDSMFSSSSNSKIGSPMISPRASMNTKSMNQLLVLNTNGGASNSSSAMNSASSNSGGTSITLQPIRHRITLTSVVSSLLPRLLKRLKLTAARSQLRGTPESQDRARFLNRCHDIYRAHASEIEVLLTALGSGDRNQVQYAKYLIPQLPQKNYLLSNAFDATDNGRYEKEKRLKERKEWSTAHHTRMHDADIKRLTQQREKRDQVRTQLETKESHRLLIQQQNKDLTEREKLQEFQKKWLVYLSNTLRHIWIHDARYRLHPILVECFRKNRAVRCIQAFIRAKLLLKRKSRARLQFLALKSLVQLMAFNYGCIKYDRASNLIKLFLSQKRGVDSVSRLIRNFRTRVGICQNAVRRWLQTKKTKLDLWRWQYDRMIRMKMNSSAIGSASVLEDTAVRDNLLKSYFNQMKLVCMRDYDNYEKKLIAYQTRVDEEAQKQRVLKYTPDHPSSLLQKPLHKKIPVKLSDEALAEMIEQALIENRDSALKKLHSTTELDMSSGTDRELEPSPGRRSSMRSPIPGSSSGLSSRERTTSKKSKRASNTGPMTLDSNASSSTATDSHVGMKSPTMLSRRASLSRAGSGN